MSSRALALLALHSSARRRSPAEHAAKCAAIILCAAIVLGFATGHSGVLRTLVPALAFALAALLFHTDRRRYLQFVFSVWFFVPLLRRLVDYQSGWVDPSPILLTPYLVTLVGPLLFLPHMARMPVQRWWPFLAALVAIAAGLLSGVCTYPVNGVVMALVNWLSPVMLGAVLFTDREHSSDYLAALPPLLPSLALITAAYTLLQFFFLFPWDALWLTNINLPSMGIAQPLELRAFGPLNSCGVCALALAVCGLATQASRRTALRVAVLIFSGLALLVTQVRAGLLVLLLGLLLLLATQLKRTMITLLVTVGLCAGVAMAGIGAVGGPAAATQVVADRLKTFAELKDDQSASSRLGGYQVAFDDIASHPFGHGLGVPEDIFDIQGSFSLRDSGPIDVFVSMGWLGAFLYLPALLTLAWRVLRKVMSRQSGENVFYGIAALSLLGVFPLSSVGVTVPGLLLWTFLPLALIDTSSLPSDQKIDDYAWLKPVGGSNEAIFSRH